MQYSLTIIMAFLAIGALAVPIQIKRDGSSIQIYCPGGHLKDAAGEMEASGAGCIPKRDINEREINAYGGPGTPSFRAAEKVKGREISAYGGPETLNFRAAGEEEKVKA